MLKTLTLLISLWIICSRALAQQVIEPATTPAEWSKSYPPFQIAGNLYYIGTYDLACYLITTPKGNILINTGLASSQSMIKASIESLGFKFSDIKILLTTQAHYDHLGAMAAIKKITRAQMMINAKDASVLEDGGKSDYALGGATSTFEPLRAERLLQDGDIIKLGDMQMVMLHHPGHTKGSCSFLLDVKDDKRTYRVLIANMPTIVTDKDFTQIPQYPDIAKDYAYSLKAMKKLSFDIWLSSHASQFGLHSKHKPNQRYNPAVFFDQKGYEAAINNLQQEFLNQTKAK
jgi:metallo-beta-lactamase class B